MKRGESSLDLDKARLRLEQVQGLLAAERQNVEQSEREAKKLEEQCLSLIREATAQSLERAGGLRTQLENHERGFATMRKTIAILEEELTKAEQRVIELELAEERQRLPALFDEIVSPLRAALENSLHELNEAVTKVEPKLSDFQRRYARVNNSTEAKSSRLYGETRRLRTDIKQVLQKSGG